MSTLSPTFNISGASGTYNVFDDLTPSIAGGVAWFIWTCPASGDYFVSTRDGGQSFTNYFSAITVYQSSVSNPTDTSQLTQFLPPGDSVMGFPNLLWDQSQGVGNGFEMGSYAAFSASAGTTYIFGLTPRVPVLVSNPSGYLVMHLAWGAYVIDGINNAPYSFGPCSTGNPVNFGGGVCVGQLNVPPSPGSQNYWEFGSYSQMPGFFTCRYDGIFYSLEWFCLDGGSWPSTIPNYADGTAYSIGAQVVDWSNCLGQPFFGLCIANVSADLMPPAIGTSNSYWTWVGASFTGTPGPYNDCTLYTTGTYVGDYNLNLVWQAAQDVHPHEPGVPDSSGPPTVDSLFWQKSFFGGAAPYGCSPNFAISGVCPPCNFNNQGGIIGVALNTASLSGFASGNFYLLYTDIKIGYFSLNADNFGVSASGGNWKMSPVFLNSNSNGWDGVTVGLELNNVSTGVTDTVTFPVNGTQTVTFNPFSASPSTTLYTATFTFTRNNIQFGTIANIPLYPLLSAAPNTLGCGPVTSNTISFAGCGAGSNIPGCSSTNGFALQMQHTSPNGDASSWFNGAVKHLVSITGSGQLYDGVTCTPVGGTLTVADGAVCYISNPAINTGTVLTIQEQYVVGGNVIHTFPAQNYTITF